MPGKVERKSCPSCNTKFPANFGFCPGCGGEVKGKSVEPDHGNFKKAIREAVAEEFDSRGFKPGTKVKDAAVVAGKQDDDDFDEGFDQGD